ncbi:MAG: protein translocase subunit SecF [Pseudomonadota bacterium]
MFMRYVPDKTNLGFMRLRIPSFLLSVAAIGLSIFLIMTQGLNLGIDFRGGSVIETTKPAGVEVENIRGTILDLDFNGAEITEARGTGVDAAQVFVVKIPTQDAEEGENPEAVQQQATDLIANTLTETYSGLEVRGRETVGPKVSGELLTAGVTALAVALALMMIYISFRFKWHYALGAVTALVHDVILTIGVFAGLQLEFNLSTIAALLTIVGYSMNDTVVVFDRVREEARKYKQMPSRELIDLSLNGTLSRTLLTSGTTLLALLAIFILGGPVLRGMSFALIWGVIVGTYSSIFVASSLLLALPEEGWRRTAKKPEVEGFQPTA